MYDDGLPDLFVGWTADARGRTAWEGMDSEIHAGRSTVQASQVRNWRGLIRVQISQVQVDGSGSASGREGGGG